MSTWRRELKKENKRSTRKTLSQTGGPEERWCGGHGAFEVDPVLKSFPIPWSCLNASLEPHSQVFPPEHRWPMLPFSPREPSPGRQHLFNYLCEISDRPWSGWTQHNTCSGRLCEARISHSEAQDFRLKFAFYCSFSLCLFFSSLCASVLRIPFI